MQLYGHLYKFKLVVVTETVEEGCMFNFSTVGFDINLFNELLVHHFNYELALDPLLNCRVQVGIGYDDRFNVLDIYDDRGYFVYQGFSNK